MLFVGTVSLEKLEVKYIKKILDSKSGPDADAGAGEMRRIEKASSDGEWT